MFIFLRTSQFCASNSAFIVACFYLGLFCYYRTYFIFVQFVLEAYTRIFLSSFLME